MLHIRAEADSFVDRSAKSFHVAREESEYFREHSDILPTMTQIQSLCKAIVRRGHIDTKRATGQYRVNIGNGSQNWVNGAPCILHGLKFQKDIENDNQLDRLLSFLGESHVPFRTMLLTTQSPPILYASASTHHI